MAGDYAHQETDRMLDDLERRIFSTYQQAASEIEQKLLRHLEAYGAKDQAMRARRDAGEITTAQYNHWRTGQILTGERWERMRENLSEDMYNYDSLAASMINEHTPEVYALNHDYGTYEAESGSGLDTSYTLYNRQTVERLMTHDDRLIPDVSPNHALDVRWNQKQFNAGILQGILQGESVGELAHRVALGTSQKDFNAALRNARTATTSAQNAGRSDAYKRAEKMGVKLKQMWLANRDKRTRDSHIALDGQVRAVGEFFESPISKMLYPGDREHGKPEDVWGCRCRLVADVKGINFDVADMSMRNDRLEGMPYDEWKKAHMSEENYEKWKAEYDKYRKEKSEEISALDERMKRITGGQTQRKAESGPEKTEGYDFDGRKKIWDQAESLRQQMHQMEYGSEERQNLKKQVKEIEKQLSPADKQIFGAYEEGIEHIKVRRLEKALSSEEIIQKLAGGDETEGSCASLALAYMANRNGLDVTDFRGGDSRKWFSQGGWDIKGFNGVKTEEYMDYSGAKAATHLLKEMDPDREYILSVGYHSAVVRKDGKNSYQYLEMQNGSGGKNGWHKLNAKSLHDRFGAKTSKKWREDAYLFDVDIPSDDNEFAYYMGYLNTASDKQQKSSAGFAK